MSVLLSLHVSLILIFSNGQRNQRRVVIQYTVMFLFQAYCQDNTNAMSSQLHHMYEVIH